MNPEDFLIVQWSIVNTGFAKAQIENHLLYASQ